MLVMQQSIFDPLKLGVNNSCSYEKIGLCNKAPQNLYNNYYFIKAVYNTEDL